MSKSNNRYGKTLYKMYQSVDADPKPTPRLLAQWKRLDEYANKSYGKQYDALTDDQKVQLHFNINTGLYKNVGKTENEKTETVAKQ